MSARTPLIRDEEQPTTEPFQVLSNGSLQLRDVTSRDISSFTCVVPLQDDARLAVAETFTITLQGSSPTVSLHYTCRYIFLTIYVHIKTASNGSSYVTTVIGTLAVDGWAVTFGTARRGLGGLRPRPVPSSLYQM